MTIVVFAACLLFAVPVAFVLILTAIWYVQASGNGVLFDSFAQQLFSGLENYGLLAIPLFMMTGELMNEGGMTQRLVQAARVFVGGFRGGLAYINLLANMFMAAIIGSAASQIAVMSRAMVPEMEKEGYSRGFSAATTAAGGLLAPVVPPSMMFVIYGVLAQLPIGDMFIAGIIPGVLLFCTFVVVVTAIGFFQEFPKGEWMTRPEAMRALVRSLPASLIPITIIGGILLGIATPTESAAVASLVALVMAVMSKQGMSLLRLFDMFRRTAINSGMVIFMIAAANVFGWVIVYEALPQKLAASITQITDNPFVFLLIVNAVLLMVGMLIDGIAAVILITPILLPIATGSYDIDPFQFGVVICLNLVLGLLTPPVGVGLFITSSMTGAKVGEILASLWPFLLAVGAVLIALSYWPALSTALL